MFSSLDSIIPLSPSSVQVFLTTNGFFFAFIWLGYLFKPFVWVVCKNYLDYLIKSSQKLSILLQKTFGRSLICWSNFWNYCKRFFFWLSIFTAVWLKGICCSIKVLIETLPYFLQLLFAMTLTWPYELLII